MKYSVLIVAAGSGTRMNLGFNKVYAVMKNGKTILETTISVFKKDPDCNEIIVVTDREDFEKYIGKREHVTIVSGGSTRQESVSNGLAKVTNDYVFIHDGARPFVDQDSLDRLKGALQVNRAALLAVACKDTIKVTKDGYVSHTPDRSALIAAQTPQAFAKDLILSCMELAKKEGFTGTDDCSLVERFSNEKIAVVEGSYANIKITTKEDLC